MEERRKQKNKVIGSMLILSVVALMPVVYMILVSLKDGGGVSLMAYYRVFLEEPGYLMKFWRSLGLCTVIAAGQTVISCMGGVAFAKLRFPAKKILFLLMALFMILPIQVTLLPNYILLDKMHILNTWWALILPGIFAPFGTIWMTFVFKALPTDLLDSSRLDGAGILTSVFRIMVPAMWPAVITLFIISFVDSWNMVEQPVTFLEGTEQYPLSVFLVGITENSVSVQAVCGILCLIPVTFLFLYFRDEMSEGIGDSIWS